MSLPRVSTSKGKNVRCSPQQITKLVEYMSTHNNFANRKFTGPLGRRQQNKQWVQLQQMLREYGPDKTVEQWRVTWRDLKKKARTETRAWFAASATGNQLTNTSLSELNQKILGIIGEEGTYGIGLTETGLGSSFIIPEPEPSPPLVPLTPPILPRPPPSSATPPLSAQPPTSRQRPAGWLQTKEEFLSSEAKTRDEFKMISNHLDGLRRATIIQTRIRMAERLRASRMDKLKYL